MEDLFRTYLIETVEKRIKRINMIEEDRENSIWEDLIKFFMMAGELHIQNDGNVIEICIETRRIENDPEFDWIQLYRRGNLVMIKGESLNKLFGENKFEGEIYFISGNVNTQKGWYYEMQFVYDEKLYILRFMNEGLNMNKRNGFESDKLAVEVKYWFGRYPVTTDPIPINTVYKKSE